MIGLSIGEREATFVRARGRGGQVQILDAQVVRTDEAALSGHQVAELLGKARCQLGEFRLGVRGRDSIIRYVHLREVPSWRLRLLMDVEIEDVAEKAGEALSADYRPLPLPVELRSDEADDLAILVAFTKEQPLLDTIGELAAGGVQTESACPTPVALFNGWVALGNVASESTVALVDVGDDAIELALVRDGMLLFARTLAPVKQFDARSVQQVASAVSAAVKFASSTQRLRSLKIDVIHICGRYGEVEALRSALTSTLSARVETYNPLERADVSELRCEDPDAMVALGCQFAIALGLAMGGSHPRTITPNLLPIPLKKRREFRQRTVWLMASGILLAIALSVLCVTAALQRSGVRGAVDDLRNLRRGLESRLATIDATSAANRVRLDVLTALSQPTQRAAAVMTFLDVLDGALPKRVTVERIVSTAPEKTQAARSSGDEPVKDLKEEPGIAFALYGVVDDVAGDAATVLTALERALRASEGVVRAAVTGTPQTRPGALVAFTMAIRITATAPELQ